MNLSSAFFANLNSTTVRFIIAFLLFSQSTFSTEDGTWRRDSVREQQVAERIYQWQKRGHFSLQYCWQTLHIDDRTTRSFPEQNRLAAHSELSDSQIRADYVRQQWFCLLQQNPTLRAAAVEKLRRRLPSIQLDHADVTTRYSELLAAQMALNWLRENGEANSASYAQTQWQTLDNGQNYISLFMRSEASRLIALQLQHQLLPSTQQFATFQGGID